MQCFVGCYLGTYANLPHGNYCVVAFYAPEDWVGWYLTGCDHLVVGYVAWFALDDYSRVDSDLGSVD